MKSINHLSPLYNLHKVPFLSVNWRTGFNWAVFSLCNQLIPELKTDFFADFPFNPKHCPKVAQRRIRKACYQSFALYKKSYKPKRIPRIRIIKDEGYVLWGAKQEVPRSSFFHRDYGVNLPADLLWKH